MNSQKLYTSLVSICLLLLIFYLGRHLFIPLAFAALFAMALVSTCNFIERYKVPRGLSSLISTIAFAIVGFLFFFFSSLQMGRLKSSFSGLAGQLSNGVNQVELWIQKSSGSGAHGTTEWIRSYTSGALANFPSYLNGTISFVSGTLVYLVLIPIYTFLLLYYRGLILEFFVKKFGEGHLEKIQYVSKKARFVIKGYIGGLLIEMLIVALLNCLGIYIIGMKYALLAAVIFAIINLIPYIGIFIACTLSLLITLHTDSPDLAIRVVQVLVAIHLIDAYFLFPRVVGSKVKINALAVILGVITGNIIWGIPGMFLSLPAIALLKVVFDEVEGLKAWGLLLGDVKI